MRPTGPTSLIRRIAVVSDRRPRRIALASVALLLAGLTASAPAHDIPNARVDRSTQVTLEPGRLRIDYEVSLSELTLTQELRSLIGALPGADRRDWFEAYGRETGPLNAKGFLVTVGEEPMDLRVESFDLAVEEHPRYTFHFSTEIPPSGRLSVRDTNFMTSEGTSRLAVRGRGVKVLGDDLPGDVEAIPARPLWQLTDLQERRTRGVVVEFSPAAENAAQRPPIASPGPVADREPPASVGSAPRLTGLLDGESGLPLVLLAPVAFGLGAVHAIQPGHGKTLVAATVLTENGSWLRGALLAALTTLAHTSSVFLVAGLLWWTESKRFETIHLALYRSAGFVIAAIGLWRLGRHLAGYSEHGVGHEVRPLSRGEGPGLIGLGVAGGLVPCWDAVGLVLLSEAVGRLGLGLLLVVAFSLGMGLVLVSIAWLVTRLRRSIGRTGAEPVWQRRLGVAGGLVLSSIGVYLLRI
jgi:ABC-type nickel/cobalt efflux system permease component RcnA